MAVVHVTIAGVRNNSRGGESMPVADSVPYAAEDLTSSGTSAASTISAPSVNSESMFWVVTALGDVWVKFGATPTAAAGEDWLVPAGTSREFTAVAGHKIAVIDVA